MVESIQRGDINQSSFAFSVDQQDVTENDQGEVIREILAFKRLYDVSPVTYPAYVDTVVDVRSIEQFKKQKKERQEESVEKESEELKDVAKINMALLDNFINSNK